VLPRLPTDTPEVRALCERLVPGEIPVVLEVEHPPWAKPRDCTANVQRAVADHGGSVRYGWQLWEVPDVMLEAEFHAVWVDARGSLRDVTPKDLPFERCIFLPDPTLHYEGRQIDNVRVPLQDDPLIHEFIAAAEAYYEATNRGELAEKHGDITPFLTPAQKKEIAALTQRRMQLQLQVAAKYHSP
jgi:hypothetical protein